MSDPTRPVSGIQPILPGARMISPVSQGGAPSVTIPMVQNPYGLIAAQPHQYMSHLTYTNLPNVQGRMPLVGALPPSMPGMYVPVAQVPGTPVLAAQMPAAQVATTMVPTNVNPAKLLEHQRKLEKERNFQMQQQRLKQFTIAGKKGNINADNLIDSMFGKSHTKESSQLATSSSPKHKDLSENKKPVTISNVHPCATAVYPSSASVPPSSVTVPPFSSGQLTNPPSGTSFIKQVKNDKKELDAMMLECSDLKGPQKANKFSKPAVKEMAPSTQLRSTFTASNKARNWSDVKGLDEVFVDKRPRFPSWCCKENVPELYRKVESIVTENGAHAPETNLLFPILMSSNLPQQSLAQIWELVNQSAPGYLTTEEMYAALALIAVAQAGHVVKTADILHQLPSSPVPQLQCFMNPVETANVEKELMQTALNTAAPLENASIRDSSGSPVHHVVRPTTISLKSDSTCNLSSSNATENHSSLPPISSSGFTSSPDDEFDDFKSATPTCVNFFMHPPSSGNAPQEEDEFDDFKQAPVVSTHPVLSKETKDTISTAITAAKQSVVEQDLMSPEEDKYSVFRLLQQREDSSDWGDFASVSTDFKGSAITAPSNTADVSSDNNSLIEPAVFATKTGFAGANVPNVGNEVKDDDEFGDFLHAEVTQVPSLSTDANHFQNMTTDFANFANFNENAPPLPTFSVSGSVQLDDEFGEFASSLPVSGKGELGQEFLFRHLKDNISLAESQSVSSLELGTFDGGGQSGESKSSLSRQGSIPSLDLKSTCIEATEGEDCFGEFQNASVLNKTSKSPSPAKDVKGVEHSQGLNFQTTRSIPLTDKYSVIRSEERKEEDQHISNWTNCLQSAVNILQNTRKIFNQMSCSSVCNEILSSEEGGNYIKDVIEVYKVIRRIELSSKSFGKQTIAIRDSLKEADQAWNTVCGFFAGSPLMPQDSSFDFTSALLSADNDDNTKACGLCLLNVEIKISKNEDGNLKLSYGGRNYHSTCANFWVNCVDPLLPALSLPQLL